MRTQIEFCAGKYRRGLNHAFQRAPDAAFALAGDVGYLMQVLWPFLQL